MAATAQSISRMPHARRAITISPALAYAIRFGVAVSAAIWIGNAPGLAENNPSWILITVLMIMQPTTGNSVAKGMTRAVGTLAAAFTAIGLFGFFAQTPPLLMTGLFLVSAISAYGNSGARYQYAWFVFGFTTAIVLGDAMAGSDAVETVAFQRASMVGLGILLVMVVDSLFWPTRAEPQLRASLAARARRLGGALEPAIPLPSGASDDEASLSLPDDSGVLAKQLALVDAARSELGVSRAAADRLARIAMLLETLTSRTRVIAIPIDLSSVRADAGRGVANALRSLKREVSSALESIAEAISADRAPESQTRPLEEALLALDLERDRLTPRHGWSPEAEGRAADVRDLVSVLRTLESALSPAANAPTSPESSRARKWLPTPDPFRMKVALRTGFAVVAAFLIPAALGWPMNTTVAAVALMASGFTRGSGVQTLPVLTRVLAISWLVADLLLVYVTPHLERAPIALLVPFAVASVFAYVGSSRPKLAPLPSIGGLVALLSVFGGMSAPTDVYGSYNTVSYVAVGLGTGWLFSRLMWPATAAGIFRQRMAAQLERCLETIENARETRDVRRMANLFHAFSQQTAQLGTLHAQASHEPVERGLDESRRGQILRLVMDLMDTALSQRPEAIEHFTARGDARIDQLGSAMQREYEALVESLKRTIADLRGEGFGHDAGLAEAHDEVNLRIDALRAEFDTLPVLSDEERKRFIIELDSRRRLVFKHREIEAWLSDWRAAQSANPLT